MNFGIIYQDTTARCIWLVPLVLCLLHGRWQVFFSFTDLLACSYTVKQLLSLNRFSNDVASYSFLLEVVDN